MFSGGLDSEEIKEESFEQTEIFPSGWGMFKQGSVSTVQMSSSLEGGCASTPPNISFLTGCFCICIGGMLLGRFFHQR